MSKDKKKIYVAGRPVGGVTLNGLEYCIDKQSNVITFGSRSECLDFVRENITKEEPEFYAHRFEDLLHPPDRGLLKRHKK
jgi:hypothetical protein